MLLHASLFHQVRFIQAKLHEWALRSNMIDLRVATTIVITTMVVISSFSFQSFPIVADKTRSCLTSVKTMALIQMVRDTKYYFFKHLLNKFGSLFGMDNI